MVADLRIKPSEVSFDPLADSAIQALASRVQAVVHVATGESVTAATLARLDGVHLLAVERTGALSAREPRLRPLVIPQGSIELRSDIPGGDIPAVATQTQLLVRPGLHPALQRVLLDVAGEVHSVTGFLERQGQFPTTRGLDFPASEVAMQTSLGARARGWKLCCPTGRHSWPSCCCTPCCLCAWVACCWRSVSPVSLSGE